MNTFGLALRVSLWGESHGPAVGALLDGLPAGLPVDAAAIAAAMAERRPGPDGGPVSQRREPDAVAIESGVHAGRTTGHPVLLRIANADARPQDYAFPGPRPGHADFPESVRTGVVQPGGGHQSGRLTAPLVAAGALVAPLLARHGVTVAARLQQVGEVCDDLAAMRARVEAARRAGDSVGGIVAFVAEGLPVGLGEPHLAGLEPHLGHLLLAVPGVKGVEFGHGFAAAAMAGSAHNDPYEPAAGGARPASNHAGGALGGRATGLPFTGRVAFKPASSIALPQRTVDAAGQPAEIQVGGRHDPCIAVRGTPVVAACVRLAVADLLLARTDTLL
ncbi:MAG: chorismate synthase [Thermoplasmata archaeon]|jgi:chorismate synthase|nr:chorismate synthase [Thermoplasmata archaeon]